MATFEEGEWENRKGENTDTSCYWESHPHRVVLEEEVLVGVDISPPLGEGSTKGGVG